jgi:hypothetical protein
MPPQCHISGRILQLGSVFLSQQISTVSASAAFTASQTVELIQKLESQRMFAKKKLSWIPTPNTHIHNTQQGQI